MFIFRSSELWQKKKQGMTREDIIADTGIPNSGALTAKLEELESCGFIRKYTAFGQKKKNAQKRSGQGKKTKNIRCMIHDFQTATGTHFAIYPTLITTHGMVANAYFGEIRLVIVMDDLFLSIMNKSI